MHYTCSVTYLHFSAIQMSKKSSSSEMCSMNEWDRKIFCSIGRCEYDALRLVIAMDMCF